MTTHFPVQSAKVFIQRKGAKTRETQSKNLCPCLRTAADIFDLWKEGKRMAVLFVIIEQNVKNEF